MENENKLVMCDVGYCDNELPIEQMTSESSHGETWYA